MLENVRHFFSSFDMFAASPTLRAKSKSETSNTLGGVISLMILILFFYLFVSQIVQVASWNKIKSVESQTNNLKNSKTVNEFVIAIGIEGVNLTTVNPFFRFQFNQITFKENKKTNNRTLAKEPCTVQHFADLGDDAQQAYQTYQLYDKYCIVPGQDFQITPFTPGIRKALSFQVNSCRRVNLNNESLYTGCATEVQFNFANMIWINYFKYFTAVAYFINTAFKPTQEVPASKFLDVVRSTFTLSRGSQTIVYLSPYQINTDTSMFPISEQVTETGFALEQFISQNFEAVPTFQYVNIAIVLSTKVITFDRTVGKVDQVLSYVGGLFGIVMAILGFFLANFNEYRYELMVGEGAFNYSDDGSKVREHDFNFLQYVRYCAWDWVKTLTCVELDWKKCREIDETREEANNQLDVTLLFKKIQHFERVIEYLISDKENIGIYLTEPPSIEEVRRTRQITEYYEKVIKGKSATTVEDVENVDNVFNYAVNQENSRTDLIMTSSASKRKLHDQPEKSRQNILDRILSDFNINEDIQDVNLNEDELKIEQQIAEAFFRMAETPRTKIQQKIPLKILHRLKRKYEDKISKETTAINLQI